MFHRAVVETDTSLLTAETPVSKQLQLSIVNTVGTRSSRVHKIRQIRRRPILKMSGEELYIWCVKLVRAK